MLASYNPLHNNILIIKHMLIFTMGDLFMNLVSTVIVFSIYGYLATLLLNILALSLDGRQLYKNMYVAMGHLSFAHVFIFVFSILFLLCLSVNTQF